MSKNSSKTKKQVNKQEDTAPIVEAAGNATVVAEDDPVSKVSINKYDPFQLKGTLDDEFTYVFSFCSLNQNLAS